MEAEFIAIVNVLPLLENRAFVPRSIFHLYWEFLSFVLVGATNWYKCPITEARRDLIHPTQYKCLTFVPVGGSVRYKCDVLTFIPGQDTTWYKCRHICTGPCLGPVQM
jgi:hypothetical protein